MTRDLRRSEATPAAPAALADRYGAPRPARRRALVVGVLLVAAAFLGWLAWAAWAQVRPDVSSELTGFRVVDDNTALATVTVAVADGVDARCVVRALAEDHTLVGELTFVPADGRSTLRVRTDRRATAVTLVGCTTTDQPRPR